ncbi:MAG TPA: sugar ABC transporter substrate-binding protein [Kaistia sp.]|nr:sugar ABC transporter substrate-binding protein [Kaistia sp.]
MSKTAMLLAGAIGLLGSTMLASAEDVTLDVWTIDRESDPGYMYVMAQEFQKLHPDIKFNIKHVEFADWANDITRAVATGTAPDVAYVDNPNTPFLSSKGALLDISPYLKDSTIVDTSKIFPGPLSTVTWDGKIYGLPRGSNTIALYYNKDMFKAAGLDPDKPPQTWDQLYDAAKKLTDPAKNVYGLAFSANANEEGTFQFLPWIQSTGGNFDKVNGEGAVQALELWQKIIDEKLASPDTLIRGQYDSFATFNAGNAAMAISGPWELPRMSKDAKFDVGVALLPIQKEGDARASALGEGNNVIFAKTKHPKEAFMYLEYMYSQMPRVWNEFGFVPSYPVDVKDPKWPSEYAVFIESMKYARARGPSPDWAKISKAISTAIQQALTHQADAQTALNTAQTTIDGIVKK